MRKKTSILTIAVPIIIITFIVLSQLGLFKNIGNFKVIPIEGPGKTASNTPYSCPLSATECQVSATINCDTANTQSKVSFRTNGNWIAWDMDGSGLRCYSSKSNPSPNCNIPYTNYITIPDSIPGYGGLKFYGSASDIFTKKAEVTTNYCADIRIFSGTGCDLTPTSKEPYKSNNQEIVSGNVQAYYCTGQVTKSGSSNVEQLVYSSSVKGSKTSNSYTLKPGEKLTVTGGSSNYVSYNSYFVTECDFNYCSGNNIYKCDNGRKTSVYTSCGSGYICTGGLNANATCVKQAVCSGTSNCNAVNTGFIDCNNGQTGDSHPCNTDAGEICGAVNSVAQCIPPFKTLSINPSKVGFSKEEGALINVEAVSTDSRSDISTGFVRIYLSTKPDFSELKGTYEINPFDYRANIKRDKQITGLDYGTYYVKMDLNYNGKVLKVPEVKSFKVNPKMVISLDVKSGTEGLSSLFVKNPVLIEVFSSDSSKTIPVDADSVTLNVKINGYEVSNLKSNPSRTSGSAFVYSYEFTPLTKGNLDVVAYATKGGVQSNTETVSREIKDLQIEVVAPTFLGISCAKVGDTKTFTFDTKVTDEYVDANNKLEVIEPLLSYYQDITGTIKSISTGRYSFDYTFSKTGVYKFRLVSTSSKYNIGSEPILPQITVQDTCAVTPKECTMTEDCDTKYGLGYRCIDGKCVKKDDPLILYLIVVGIAIVLVIVIVVVVISRKKRSEVNLGGLSL